MKLSGLIFLLAFPVVGYGAQGVSVAVTLNPAGSFKAETTSVKGFATKTADGVMAENIEVDLRTLTTGISLRDKHTKKHLMADKYPMAKLIKATGKGGKGTATIEIKGIKDEVSGTYEIKGDSLVAKFPIHLKDLKIEDINYMGVGVEDDVQLTVTVPIKAAGGAASPARKTSSVGKTKKK